MVGIGQSVQGHQIARTDVVTAGDAGQGFTRADQMATGACLNGGARNGEPAADFDMVGVADVVHLHQLR